MTVTVSRAGGLTVSRLAPDGTLLLVLPSLKETLGRFVLPIGEAGSQ